MKKLLWSALVLLASPAVYAQIGTADTTVVTKVTVNKDPRLDILAKAEFDMNKLAGRFTKGYRLFVLKTDNREYAMKVRSYLLQNFPEEKVIMTYQSPFIKMKFGDFENIEDAEKFKNLIIKGKAVTGGIYIVPDMVELKPDKIAKEEL
jgi:phosphate-selective porin